MALGYVGVLRGASATVISLVSALRTADPLPEQTPQRRPEAELHAEQSVAALTAELSRA